MPKQVSKIQLNIGYWLLNHRKQMQTTGLVLFIMVDIIIIIFFLINFGKYFTGLPVQNRMIASMAEPVVDFQAVHLKNSPITPQVHDQAVVTSSLDRYDFLAKIKNPNNRWIVKSFQYRFKVGGETTGWQTGYLSNNEEKYFFYIGFDYSGYGSLVDKTVEVELKDIEYIRVVDHDKVPKIDFVIEGTQHKILSLAESGDQISQVVADITNDSVYSFWQVGIQIVLLGRDKPISINFTTVNSLDTLQTKSIDVKWLNRISGVTEVIIVPEINILDDDNYKRYNIEL